MCFGLAAIVFLAIYEPLTRSTRENTDAARKGLVLDLDPSKIREIRISTGLSQFDINESGTAGAWDQAKDRADPAMVERLLKVALDALCRPHRRHRVQGEQRFERLWLAQSQADH
jgi:hypothetical protein